MIALPSVSALTEWRTFSRHNPDNTRLHNLSHAIDVQFEFAFDHLINLFLWMEVLVN